MLRRIIVVIFCVFLLSGCSQTELVYRNADWLAYRWVDRLLDADQAQSEQWSLLFERVMEEHRRELLPQVVALLNQASQQADRGLSADRLGCLWQGADRLIETHGRLIVPAATQVLSGISSEQIEHLNAELEERNAEYRDDYLHPDAAEREAARIERFIERVERWTGELTTEQARLVEAAVQRMPDIAGDWLDYRERQQQRLLALLRADQGAQAVETFLIAWWVEAADRDPRLVNDFQQLRDGWIRMLVELDATLDEQQRDHLLARLTDLRDDLAGEIDSGASVAALRPVDPVCSRLL